MRKTDIETIGLSAWGDTLATRILDGEVDANFVIQTLEPYTSQQRRDRLKQVFSDRIGSVTAVFDNLCDPHNGAALIRSCDAFGVGTVHLIERGASFLAHASIARGTHKWVQVKSHANIAQCVSWLKQHNFTLVATHPQGSLIPCQLAQIERVALVLGNEHHGIAPELYQSCNHSVKVPMRGFAESLNVSVCGAILLAHATQQRRGDLSASEITRLYARGLAVSVPNARQILQHAAHVSAKHSG